MIVEDEILIAETIKMYLSERGHRVTDIVISFDEAVAAFEKDKPDVILLDVRLYGKKSGIDFAEYLISEKHSTPFVFLTSQFDKRIVQTAMATNPQGYLTKPIQKESLWTTTELAYHRRFASPTKVNRKIQLHDGSTSHIILEEDITYIQSDHVYINVHTIDGQSIIIRKSLAQILELLVDTNFVQCHRGYVINLKYVSSFDASHVMIKGASIPLSRSRKDSAIQRLKDYRK